MAALNFPTSPSVNDIYSANGQSYRWDGTSWNAISAASSGAFNGFRNRIINGDMRIDQRNEGSAATVNSGTNTYGPDRFLGNGMSAAGVFTLQRSTTAPTGFTNSLQATVTTADSSIAATDRYFVCQNIEGFACADLAFGTASARSVTISFWVRSSVTGTFSGSLANSAYDRSYAFTYSITSANTWEYKTITISGDASGTWLSNNGIGIRVYFDLGAGSDFRATAGSWNASGRIGATGSANLIGTLSATWNITGVQLEVGTAASEFERRPYGVELGLCQRYFFKGGNGSLGIFATNSIARFSVVFPTVMRDAPNITANTSPNVLNPTVAESQAGSQTADFTATATGGTVDTRAASKIQMGGFSSGADGRPAILLNNCLSFSAEL